MIRYTAYLFLVMAFGASSAISPCLAQDLTDVGRARAFGDDDYERAQRKFRDRKAMKDRRDEREEDAERLRQDKDDKIRRDNKFRGDDDNKGAQAVHDDDQTFGGKRKVLDDSFDGSQFNSPNFAGTDFSKSNFDDLDRQMRKLDDKDLPDQLFMVDELDTPRRRLELERDKEDLLEEKLTHRPHEMAGDWVPAKLDPENNGGFASESDNGAPVPYKLNGHIDFQRKPPWE